MFKKNYILTDESRLWEVMVVNTFNSCSKVNPFLSVGEKGSPLNWKKLYQLWEDAVKIDAWCDYLRFILSDDYYKDSRKLRRYPIFNIINSSNSSDMNIEWYHPYWVDENSVKHFISLGKISIVKSEWSWRETFIFQTTYEDTVIELLEVSFFDSKSSRFNVNHLSLMIDIKWKAFRLEKATAWAFKPYEFLKWILLSGFNMDNSKDSWIYFNKLHRELDLLEILSNTTLTRYDYRIDFFLPKWHIGINEKELFKNTRACAVYGWWAVKYKKRYNSCPYWIRDDAWRIYTWFECWRWNKYITTRFYQKQVDTWLKWNQGLYAEYMNYRWEVWRYESQFESKFCQARWKYNIYEVFEEYALMNQIFEYLWLNPKAWAFCLVYKPEYVDLSKTSYSNQRRKIVRYMNDSRRFVDSWFNVNEIIDMALSDEQKEKLKTLNSKEKIGNAMIWHTFE